MSDYRIRELLRDDRARQILVQVADRRKVELREVQTSVGLDSDETMFQLGRLKDAHLIEEDTAPFQDFSVFYPTAEGLEALRHIQRSALW